MKIAFFSCHSYEQPFLEAANNDRHQLTFFHETLTPETAHLATGYQAICVFVNDDLSRPTLEILMRNGVQLAALRCTGYNQVDIPAAQEFGIRILRVPTYSPHAVAEHAVALLMALNRKTHIAYQRTKKNNFTLDGLMGFDLYGKRIGIIGTGRIGMAFARIMLGFGCRVLAYDKVRSALLQQLGVEYLPLNELLSEADIISLHCPLTPETYHLIDAAALSHMKRGAYLVNTSRGSLLDTPAVLMALQTGQLGALGMDVYELEDDYFFSDWSATPLPDADLDALTHAPNVLVTSHQGFFTREAMQQIAHTTLNNLTYLEHMRLPEDAIVVG
ncbi:2-hydroxyacid dehydrogenase [Spirosoma endbachense]|uniref:2-hydroxyacid dehydrogenase n=1 Tax=Spirosoma endbachense TaxID=2666025 RepID=A0A6P1VV72_9BACT|nr:2-hydroxyacid dehydrogenase [Spirosoma endbachense]QHV95539.1 2-hydroxyacid dehydrogenase [Spirosoma endbachense]